MSRRVAVLGQWHQGVVAAACLAKWNHDVTGADCANETIEMLSRGKAPIFEPGLDDLISEQLAGGRLRFTNNVASAVRDCAMVVLAVDVPVDAQDSSDLNTVFELVDLATEGLAQNVVLLVTAQVPVGTCQRIRERIGALRPSLAFSLAYIPENLRLGQAIDRFQKPALPVIGTDDERAHALIEEVFAPAGVAWHRCDIQTGEMVKHALNTYLATCVSFANELGNICDQVGADGRRVGELLRLEPRVGQSAPLRPGLGFSGGTLARDVQTLRRIGDTGEIDTPFLDGLWSSNQQQNKNVVRQMTRLLGGTLHGRHLAVLGLTYKPDTSTLRRSASLEVIADALDGGAVVTAHDPRANRDELPAHSRFTFHDDPLAAVENADAVILMTPWTDYRNLDLSAVHQRMAGDILFDTAGMWNESSVSKAGLNHIGIGRGQAPVSHGASRQS